MRSLFPDAGKSSTRRARRGVLILVVLSLLVLFLMVGIAFVLTTGQFHSSAQRRSSAEVYMSDPGDTLDSAMYQVFRGTTNTRSSLWEQDMLNDLYGNDGFVGTMSAASLVPNTGGLFINIPVAAVEKATDGRTHSLSTTVGAYAGCVFTVVSGTEVGRSTRVVGYDGTNTLTVMAWETRNGRAVNVSNLAAGTRFVVNGRPFNGMGAGYNPTTGKCDLMEGSTSFESALLPNRTSKLGTPDLRYSKGGMDEPYDAPDFQNMFLAFVPVNPSETNAAGMVIPSFHRPALFNYWFNRGGANFSQMQRAVMRPLESSNYAGSVDAMSELPPSTLASGFARYGTGPWDVDNDGDGVRDSVWIDLGFPNLTAADGRMYRPLFAILVKDLGGKLSLNADGSSVHYSTTSPTSVALAGGTQSSSLPRGEGFSSGEINLAGSLFSSPTLPNAQYQNLLEGNSNWYGRYGSTGLSDVQPGGPGSFEKTSWHWLFGMPQNYFTFTGPFTANSLGRPIDTRGRLAFGLDSRGVPVYETSSTDDRIDLPTEIDLSWRAGRGLYSGSRDAPFSVHELERLLRPFDHDSPGLPSRIVDLAPAIVTNNARDMYTTDRYALDCPLTSFPRAVRSAGNTYGTTFGSGSTPGQASVAIPYSIADLLKQRLVANGLSSSAANAEVVKMLPPEILRGERFNLNRLFGNGADNNSNNVVDEPAESGEQLTYPTASSTTNVNFDYTNGDTTLATGLRTTSLGARQLYARQLFCLMMLLRDPSVNLDFDGDTTNNSLAETTRGLAQWAINVVDFRDADSIMTPFEYDTNPFNGWNVDGDLTTTGESERGVVWGCERPELLITEAIAWHDIATEDTDDDPTGLTVTPANPGDPADPTFDQRFRPKGRAFIEVYNPWAGGDKYPAELYDILSGSPVLNLNKLTPSSAGTQRPIWRILIVEGDSRESQAGTTDSSGNTQSVSNYDPESIVNADVVRSIYFSNNFTGISGHGTAYYPSSANLVGPIAPGRYAVIGSSGRLVGGSYISTVGHLTADPDGMDSNLNSTRRIVLTPATSVASNQVSVLNNGGSPNEPTAGTVPNASAIVIDSPRSFSVTEPDGSAGDPYYADSITDPTDGTTNSVWTQTAGQEGRYVPTADVPLDKQRADADASGRWDVLTQDGTTIDFRTILLQRLANPLETWHVDTNPYITIDVASMNLTVFNGADDAADPDFDTGGSNAGDLAAMERGNHEGTSLRTLWRHELPDRAVAGGNPDTSHFFPTRLTHTLGYLNKHYGYPSAMSTTSPGYPSDGTGGIPFPWLTWNNRPFLGPGELLLVPHSRASRLAFDYSPAATSFATNGNLVEGYQQPAGAFGHLLNFFDNRASGGGHYYRILDYVGVPSRFAGVQEMLNPAVFAGGTSAPAGFRAPLNFVSTQRDPGRININMISDQRVWDALMGNHNGPTWSQLVTSRRGYGTASTNMLLPENASPTFFAHPFRAFGSGDLVPLSGLEHQGIDATLWRSYNPGAGLHPSSSSLNSLVQPQSSSKPNHADRNPYFRYQEATRLDNLVTTQSNVFAVWITMGYFTVDPNNLNLQLEMGVESSGGQRHRSFYIIDRSIPVAFEPGVNHNVDDAILVRRRLE